MKFCEYCGTSQGKLLTVKHAAELLDVSPDFIRGHIAKGTINTVTLKTASGTGARQPVRIYAADLERFVDVINVGLEPMLEEVLAE